MQAGGETLSEDTQTLLLQVGRADLIAYSDVLRLGQSCSQSLSGRSFFFSLLQENHLSYLSVGIRATWYFNMRTLTFWHSRSVIAQSCHRAVMFVPPSSESTDAQCCSPLN